MDGNFIANGMEGMAPGKKNYFETGEQYIIAKYTGRRKP